jgi:hypothetical protein
MPCLWPCDDAYGGVEEDKLLLFRLCIIDDIDVVIINLMVLKVKFEHFAF